MTNIFISDGFANTASAASTATQSGLSSFIPLILIFVVFYFLLIRPQQKKIKAHQNTLNTLKKGDKVQTNSGIFGTIKAINDQENTVDLEIAHDVDIKILKQNIADILDKKKSIYKIEKNNKSKKNK